MTACRVCVCVQFLVLLVSDAAQQRHWSACGNRTLSCLCGVYICTCVCFACTTQLRGSTACYLACCACVTLYLVYYIVYYEYFLFTCCFMKDLLLQLLAWLNWLLVFEDFGACASHACFGLCLLLAELHRVVCCQARAAEGCTATTRVAGAPHRSNTYFLETSRGALLPQCVASLACILGQAHVQPLPHSCASQSQSLLQHGTSTCGAMPAGLAYCTSHSRGVQLSHAVILNRDWGEVLYPRITLAGRWLLQRCCRVSLYRQLSGSQTVRFILSC
jgi:hypothetical protein